MGMEINERPLSGGSAFGHDSSVRYWRRGGQSQWNHRKPSFCRWRSKKPVEFCDGSVSRGRTDRCGLCHYFHTARNFRGDALRCARFRDIRDLSVRRRYGWTGRTVPRIENSAYVWGNSGGYQGILSQSMGHQLYQSDVHLYGRALSDFPGN